LAEGASLDYSRAAERFRGAYRETTTFGDKPLTSAAKLLHSFCGELSRIGYDGKSPRLQMDLLELRTRYVHGRTEQVV
jgi:hypothetical protein